MIIKLTHAHIIGAFISYLIGVFIVPMVIEFSQKEGLVDLPNERKIHKTPISRLGGVAIWSSAMLTFLVLVLLSYYPYGSLLSGILLGGSLMFLLGLVDDIYNLNAKFKLFIQLSVATIVYLLGVQIDTIFNPFGGGILKLGLFSYPITVLWITGISNAVNFIDGVDGLAVCPGCTDDSIESLGVDGHLNAPIGHLAEVGGQFGCGEYIVVPNGKARSHLSDHHFYGFLALFVIGYVGQGLDHLFQDVTIMTVANLLFRIVKVWLLFFVIRDDRDGVG